MQPVRERVCAPVVFALLAAPAALPARPPATDTKRPPLARAAGIFDWSMKYQDGARPNDYGAVEMTPEKKEWWVPHAAAARRRIACMHARRTQLGRAA